MRYEVRGNYLTYLLQRRWGFEEKKEGRKKASKQAGRKRDEMR